ncbi:hypothetical protein KUCAC02_016482 [Chaenocephalus aceratus]|nr:hypothetical protein KUCAC02_016482 [Chaenocephalus aceratus]
MALKPGKQGQNNAKFYFSNASKQQANCDASGAADANAPDKVLTAIQAMKEDFVSRFDGLFSALQGVQVDLKAVTVRVTEAEDRIATNEDDVAALLAQNTAMKTTVEELVLKVDDLENRSRCSNLRLRLEQLGVESPDVHPTRLKDQLLFHIPKLQAHHQGRDVMLAFENDVGSILSQASKYGEAIHLAKAAGIIRRDFSSTFNDTDLEQAVPPSLLQFVCMIEHGADIKSQLQHGASKSDLSISQLLQYNCFAKYKEGTDVHRHSKDREPPFAFYMGLYVFAKTRKRQIIEMLHENGLSISYDRVLEISAQLGEAVVAQFL